MRFVATVVAVFVLCSCASTRGGAAPDMKEVRSAQDGHFVEEAPEVRDGQNAPNAQDASDAPAVHDGPGAQAPDLSYLGALQSRWHSERVNPEEGGTMIIQSTLSFHEKGATYERILEFRANNPAESQKSRMLEVGSLTRTADGMVISFENAAEYITAVEEGGNLLVRWSDAGPTDPSEMYERAEEN